MYSKINRLRRAGARRSDHEIHADPGIIGHVTVVQIEKTPYMSVHAPMASGRPVPMIPPLWRAKVVSMQGDKMLVQGFERLGDENDASAPHERQEWAIQEMVEQPAELASMPHRPQV